MARWIKWLDPILSIIAMGILILFLGKFAGPGHIITAQILHALTYLLIICFLIYFVLQILQLPTRLEQIEARLFDLAIFLPLLLTRGDPEISASLIIFRQVIVNIYRLIRIRRVMEFLDTLQRYPARLMAGSFLILIVFGTVLLALPISAESGQAVNLIDALFTATSATCVTGLVVVDTASRYSLFGQIIILLLIQAGGLGIMALSASAAALIGKRLALGHKVLMQNLFEASDYEDLKRVIFYIIRFTFLTELVGAIILSIRFNMHMHDLVGAFYFGIFHAVSAFCNAGFALWSNNLEGFANDPVVNLTVAGLIILGGIGFTVIGPLWGFPKMFMKYRMGAFRRLNVHTQMVLITTSILIVSGFLFLFFVESQHAFAGLDLSGKLWASFFHSVTTRTAGFDTVPINTFQMPSLFFMTILMFIGASPGSTGGGIKTTTMATLVLTARSMITKRNDVEFAGRRLPETFIIKAISVFVLALVIIPAGVLILLITEKAPFMEVLFEVISAFGTVGLSMGLTPKLTLIGKLSITLIMFIGRLGPLTVALIAGESTKEVSYRYPKGEVLIG